MCQKKKKVALKRVVREGGLKMREQTRWEPGESVPDRQQQNAKPPKAGMFWAL